MMINPAKAEIVLSIYAAVARGKRGSFVRACDVPPSVRPGEIQIVDVDPAAVADRLQFKIDRIDYQFRRFSRYDAVQMEDDALAVKRTRGKCIGRNDGQRPPSVDPICATCLQPMMQIQGIDAIRHTCNRCGGKYR